MCILLLEPTTGNVLYLYVRGALTAIVGYNCVHNKSHFYTTD